MNRNFPAATAMVIGGPFAGAGRAADAQWRVRRTVLGKPIEQRAAVSAVLTDDQANKLNEFTKTGPPPNGPRLGEEDEHQSQDNVL